MDGSRKTNVIQFLSLTASPLVSLVLSRIANEQAVLLHIDYTKCCALLAHVFCAAGEYEEREIDCESSLSSNHDFSNRHPSIRVLSDHEIVIITITWPMSTYGVTIRIMITW